MTTRRRIPRTVGGALMALGLATAPLLTAAPAHADTGSQWALSYLKYPQVNALSTGKGVTVGLIDSGVAPIPNIAGQLLPGADFTGTSDTTSVGNGQNSTDPEGHGNGMASIIAGAGNPVQGFAPQAKILPIRNMLANGEPGGTNSRASSIQYAIGQHVQVINISEDWPEIQADQTAIAAAVNANIVVVVSAGNSGGSVASESLPDPAVYPGVVVVGAVDQTGKVASFSDYGPQLTLTAPGVDILNDQGDPDDTANASGTSPAAAYVSATAALIFSEHPTWTAGQVIRDLISTADPGAGQASGQHDDHYGYGVIDPLKALQAAAPGDTTNPLLAGTGTGTGTGAGATATTAPTGADSPSSSATGAPGSSSNSGTSSSSSSGSNTLLVALGIAVVLVVLVAVIILTRRNKSGTNGSGGKGGKSGKGSGGGNGTGGSPPPGAANSSRQYQQAQRPPQQQYPPK